MKLQVRRGLKADLPTLAAGAFGFCTDTKQLYIGDGTTNHLVNTTDASEIISGIFAKLRIWSSQVYDNRDVTPAVSDYQGEVKAEFKYDNAIGSPSGTTYDGLWTIAPWRDASGGKNHQLAFGGSGGIWYRSGTHGGSWDAWRKIQTIAGITFNLGVAAVGTKLAQALIPGTFTISTVILWGDNAPTGADLIVDINKNGTTIFTTQANRPKISAGSNSGESGTPNIIALAKGDRASVDIDQVGSVIPGGNDLLVTIIC